MKVSNNINSVNSDDIITITVYRKEVSYILFHCHGTSPSLLLK